MGIGLDHGLEGYTPKALKAMKKGLERLERPGIGPVDT